jgi:sugar lactone lactonase YvrE
VLKHSGASHQHPSRWLIFRLILLRIETLFPHLPLLTVQKQTINPEMGEGELPKVKFLKVNLLVARVSALKLMVLTVAAVLFAAPAAQAGNVTTFVAFDPAKSELGENLVFDQNNNLFVSMVLTNEVRKITPEGVQSAYATFNGAPGSFVVGLAINDSTGDLFVAYDPAGQNPVVYVVHPDQSKQVIATFPIGGLLNGMTPDDDGNLYIADSFAGVIWRVSSGGGTPVVWIDLHAPGSLQGGLGPNGIKFDKYKRNLYVTLQKLQEIVRVPIDRDGQAGTPEVFVSNVTSSDDFCFDQTGNLYLATQGRQSVVRIHPDGTQETIASAADGLQNTAAVLFGRHGEARLDLYILSGIFGGTGSRPEVDVLHVGLPGLPVSIPD